MEHLYVIRKGVEVVDGVEFQVLEEKPHIFGEDFEVPAVIEQSPNPKIHPLDVSLFRVLDGHAKQNGVEELFDLRVLEVSLRLEAPLDVQVDLLLLLLQKPPQVLVFRLFKVHRLHSLLKVPLVQEQVPVLVLFRRWTQELRASELLLF